MGAHPFWYFTRYQADIDRALQELRDMEFQAGRYNPVMPFLAFPAERNTSAPGAQHSTIEEALEQSEADGTRSILDLQTIGDEADFGVAAKLADVMLKKLFGTTQPTHEMIESNMEFFDEIERGQGIYAVVFKDGRPDELFFAGYSFD
ncbi:MAG: hypothetical protein M3O30_04565 [Planctomycetota bacterium]|nr:hypothetical protein [Planctomycetota bacterium]